EVRAANPVSIRFQSLDKMMANEASSTSHEYPLPISHRFTVSKVGVNCSNSRMRRKRRGVISNQTTREIHRYHARFWKQFAQLGASEKINLFYLPHVAGRKA